MRYQGFLDQLDERTQHELLAMGTERRLPMRSFIYYENEPATTVYVLLDGIVRLERHSGGGQTSLLDLMMPGELFGEAGVLEERRRSSTAITVNRCMLVAIPGSDFLRMFEEVPALARGTASWMSLRLRGFADRFLEATHSSATSRVCARLLQLMASVPAPEQGPVIVVLPISQADLAEWAGLSREAAVKALRELREDEVIETSRGQVLVLRPEALRIRAEVSDD